MIVIFQNLFINNIINIIGCYQFKKYLLVLIKKLYEFCHYYTLYYVNDKPHLGSVYTTLICDSIARYKRLIGEDVIFITGVDEHGLKIQRTANEKGIEPKSHCDEISEVFNNNWKNWNISFDKFIRTSSKNHETIVMNSMKE